MLVQSVRGTRDILPEECLLWQAIEKRVRDFFPRYGYREIRTPIIEQMDLFVRSLGDSSDIVEKQMFVIEKGRDRLVLRPEGTAGVVRAYCEHRLDINDPIQRFFYIGPMFRGERPQKGRLRQFHQIGLELLNVSSPSGEVEILSALVDFLNDLGIENYTLKINSLGCLEDKQDLSRRLKELLVKRKNDLCPDCQRRLDKNVLRILDCKNEQCKSVVRSLGVVNDYLCSDCQAHYEEVKHLLSRENIKFVEDPLLVRGLDYYSRTVFELTHPSLGKGQNTFAAGGRYDWLVGEVSGGKINIPSIGFAIGVERLLIALESAGGLRGEPSRSRYIALLYFPDLFPKAFEIAREMRRMGMWVVMDLNRRSIKAQMRWANRIGVKWVLILGEEEANSNQIKLKNMQDGSEALIDRDTVLTELRNRL